jgi:hypothetical protein
MERASLYVDPLIGVTFYIPAGTVAEVGKQGAHAHLALRLREIVFGSAILFVNRVVGLDGHGRKRIAAFRNLVPDREIVSQVGDQRQQNRSPSCAEEYGFQSFPSDRRRTLAWFLIGVNPRRSVATPDCLS